MVYSGSCKNLSKQESLEVGFQLKTKWGDFADWQAASSRQTDRVMIKLKECSPKDFKLYLGILKILV